ncbi:MAG: ATP-binding cassette domain-containing protein [Firmicutes bacterium]|nr:ATP-binding cassette domain-containing protein [Bacillota bacterium]
MITIQDLELSFGGSPLFKEVNLKFTPGNCYGVIGANGSGKSTFLRVLSGENQEYKGTVAIPENVRMSVLKQDHFQYDTFPVLETVVMGNKKLYDCKLAKEALYAKPDFNDEDGMQAAHLEAEFADMGGWEADTEAAMLLNALGLTEELHYELMQNLTGSQKVKVLLAQALFGNPEILLLDEPTNHLDINSVEWLEEFLINYHGTVIVVSHDRHFLNNVCTHIVDIDYGKIKMYPGNYDFWYESSQLIQQLTKNENKKKEEKMAELKAFIARFGANASKAKQATSRKKLLEKIELTDMPASSRKYPYINFKPDKNLGRDVLTVNKLVVSEEDATLLNDVSFRVEPADKIAFLGDEMAITALFKCLSGEITQDSGTITWGNSVVKTTLPKSYNEYFDTNLKIVDWLRQFSKENDITYLRGYLGRMLFSGEDGDKIVKVLSGGEKVRCMLTRLMVQGGNVLILDQPTNHLDLESITALNNGLADFKGAVLFSCHDYTFMSTVANRIIELKDGKAVDYMCSYEEYLKKKKK